MIQLEDLKSAIMEHFGLFCSISVFGPDKLPLPNEISLDQIPESLLVMPPPKRLLISMIDLSNSSQKVKAVSFSGKESESLKSLLVLPGSEWINVKFYVFRAFCASLTFEQLAALPPDTEGIDWLPVDSDLSIGGLLQLMFEMVNGYIASSFLVLFGGHQVEASHGCHCEAESI